MQESQESNNLYIENDKWACPFLLAASFHHLIDFKGSFTNNGVLYWQFSPKDKALLLITQLHTKTNPPIPARDLLEATETFWQEVAKTRNRGINYGADKIR